MTTEFVCHITSCTVFVFFTESLVNLMFAFAVQYTVGFFKIETSSHLNQHKPKCI